MTRRSEQQAPALAVRVRRGALWSGASTLVFRVSNIAIMAVAARLVVPHDFGVLAVAITVHAVVSSIGELGVSSVLARGEVDPDDVAPTVAAVAITSSIVLGGAMFALARPLATWLGSAEAAGPVRVLALTVCSIGFFTVPAALLAREFRQDRIFLAAVAGALVSNPLLLVLAAGGNGAMSFAWSRLAGQLVTGLVTVAAAARYYWPRIERRVLREVLRFGLPLAGANLVGYTLLNADFAIVGKLMSPSDLGVYLLAFNAASWSYSLLGGMINNVAMPAFSRLRGDPPARARAVSGATRAIALVALPIAALTMALSGPLFLTLYGAKYLSGAPVLSTLSVYGAVFVLCLLFGNLLVAEGHTRAILAVQIGWIVALIPAMVVGVRLAGVVGAGAAHVAVILVAVLPAYLAALRHWGVARPRAVASAVAGPLAAAVACGVAAALVARAAPAPVLDLVLGGVAGVAVYVLAASPMLHRYLEGRQLHPRAVARMAAAYRRVGLAIETSGRDLVRAARAALRDGPRRSLGHPLSESAPETVE